MIYFDHSATTPVDKEVLDEMLPYFSNKFGNPSSIHKFGRDAMSGVDKARSQVANFLNCEDDEVIFTNGSTESNNLVLKGVIRALRKENNKRVGGGNCMDITPENVKNINSKKSGWRDIFKSKKSEKFHIITTQIEHKAILNPCAELEKEGVEVTYLPVDKNCLINIEDFKNAIKDNTVFVSIMYVNSEIGSMQPIREVGKIIKKINEKKYKNWQKFGAKKKEPRPQPIYFHTDATQAAGYFDCNIKRLHVDFLTISAHKIYGPKGISALYASKNAKIKVSQVIEDYETRNGTLNITGIVGLGKAVSLITKEKQEENNKNIAKLRNMLVDGIQKKIKDVRLNTNVKKSTPSHAHFTFFGTEGEAVLISLDMEGIAVSTGSACAARDLHSSHVLNAMGMSKEDANYAIRFSLGKNNTKQDVGKVLEILPGIIERIRKINPLWKK